MYHEKILKAKKNINLTHVRPISRSYKNQPVDSQCKVAIC